MELGWLSSFRGAATQWEMAVGGVVGVAWRVWKRFQEKQTVLCLCPHWTETPSKPVMSLWPCPRDEQTEASRIDVICTSSTQLVRDRARIWSPWVGKIPRRKEWLPTPVFWPGEFHGLYTPWNRTWLSDFHFTLDLTKKNKILWGRVGWE